MTKRPYRPPRPCTWDGIEYCSIHAAARANNMLPSTLRARLARGLTGVNEVRWQHAKPCKWNGFEYDSISAAARANWISREGMMYRLRRGYTCDAELKGNQYN